jgi:dihydrofolate reductase
MISIICAMGRNRAIGAGNRLPWRLPDDLRRFKRLTMGHPVIMGRRTFESIGRPLPGRRNIVLSRRAGFAAPGCEVFGSLDEAVKAVRQGPPLTGAEIFVIGGAEVYRAAMPMADRIYLTIVEDTPAGADAFFPDAAGFTKELSREESETGGHHVTYLVMERPAAQC